MQFFFYLLIEIHHLLVIFCINSKFDINLILNDTFKKIGEFLCNLRIYYLKFDMNYFCNVQELALLITSIFF